MTLARLLRAATLCVVAGGLACEAEPPLAYVYSPSGLSLRAEPSTDAPVVEVLPYGAPVTVTSVDSGQAVTIDSIAGHWLGVRSGLREGYVFDGYVTEYPPPDSAGLMPEGPLVRRAFVYGATLVSLRNRPSTQSGRLAYIEYRDSVQVLLAGLTEATDSIDGVEGSWLRVRWSGIEGYLFSAYLSQFRPLQRPFSARGESFSTAFVHGVEALTLHAAPDSMADSVGVLAAGDSVSVATVQDEELESYRGLPGRWVYATSATLEGYLFGSFLTGNPPIDSAGVVVTDPPTLRYVVVPPGVRLWERGEDRLFTRDFMFYGDSVLVLFGGRTARLAGPQGGLDDYVTVKTATQEGLVEPELLSVLPPPELGMPFRDHMEQVVGRLDGEPVLGTEGGEPSADAEETGDGAAQDPSEGEGSGEGDGEEAPPPPVVTVRYNRGVIARTVALEDGGREQRFLLPGATPGEAYRLLRASRDDAPVETPDEPDPLRGVIEVRVEGFRSAKGQALISLFLGEDGFPDEPKKAHAAVKRPIDGAQVVVVFENVPAGEFAVSAFHDEDSDFELDTGLFGIPKEDWGVSRDAGGFMGPPSYKSARLELRAGERLVVPVPLS